MNAITAQKNDPACQMRTRMGLFVGETESAVGQRQNTLICLLKKYSEKKIQFSWDVYTTRAVRPSVGVEVLDVRRESRGLLAEHAEQLREDVLRVATVHGRVLARRHVRQDRRLGIVRVDAAVRDRQPALQLGANVLVDANLLERTGEQIVDFIVDGRGCFHEFAVVFERCVTSS